MNNLIVTLDVIFIYIIAIATIAYIIYLYFEKYRKLVMKNIELQDFISSIRTREKKLIEENKGLTALTNDNKKKEQAIKDLEEIIKALTNLPSSLSVYSMSNIHRNYNFHNKRFYAKINNKPKDNKAEAIPILHLEKSKNIVIDLYKLEELIHVHKESVIDSIRESYISKADLIAGLGNKILKNYKSYYIE